MPLRVEAVVGAEKGTGLFFVHNKRVLIPFSILTPFSVQGGTAPLGYHVNAPSGREEHETQAVVALYENGTASFLDRREGSTTASPRRGPNKIAQGRAQRRSRGAPPWVTEVTP